MTPKLFKTLLIAVPSVMVGTIVIVPTAIAIAEANHEDPVPPTPPTPPDPPIPPVETVDITFDAGEGVIKSTDLKTFTLTVESGSVWSLLDKPEAYWDNVNFFDFWSLDGQTKVPEDHIFDDDETVYAVYTTCEHEFDSYSITENEKPDGSTKRRVWGHCSKCGETVELTDEQLEELEGYVLVKEDDSYRLSDSLSYEVQYTTKENIDIYLLYGTYILVGNRVGSVVDVNLHGVHKYNGGMVSTLDAYNEEALEVVEDYAWWEAAGNNVSCDNMILQGKSEYTSLYGGLMMDKLICRHCLITGGQSAAYDRGEFYNCTFDSSNIETSGKTDYCIYLLYNRYATFHDCNFISIGKAIKFMGDAPKVNTSYEFLRCNFSVTNRLEMKAAINIDSSIQSSAPFEIYISDCKLLEGYQEGDKLYEDVSGNSNIHLEPRP